MNCYHLFTGMRGRINKGSLKMPNGYFYGIFWTHQPKLTRKFGLLHTWQNIDDILIETDYSFRFENYLQ
jgi:hypothetical protein